MILDFEKNKIKLTHIQICRHGDMDKRNFNKSKEILSKTDYIKHE
jgi:hypothetical protein